MSGVRVLVGTRKGAFILTSDGNAQALGRQRPALRRLGDLSPQGIAGRSEPALRVAVQRLVRADHPALRRRRQDLGAGGQQVRVRRRPRHAPVVRRHAAPVGVQARLAPRAVARPTPTPSTPASRTRRCSARPTAARRWQELPACASHGSGRILAAGRRRHVPAHDPARPEQSRADVRRHLRRRRVPHRRRRQDLAADQPRAQVRRASPIPTPRSATASTASPCTRRARTCCSCRSTGT